MERDNGGKRSNRRMNWIRPRKTDVPWIKPRGKAVSSPVILSSLRVRKHISVGVLGKNRGGRSCLWTLFPEGSRGHVTSVQSCFPNTVPLHWVISYTISSHYWFHILVTWRKHWKKKKKKEKTVLKLQKFSNKPKTRHSIWYYSYLPTRFYLRIFQFMMLP